MSNIGSWMQTLAAQWQMTSLTTSALLVALISAANALAIFVLIVPGGVLADILSRRRLLMVTNSCMFVTAIVLATLTFSGLARPGTLLLLVFTGGLFNALTMPGWQAMIPDLVERDQFRAAVTLNGVSTNVGQAAGPALGDLVVSFGGPGAVYLLNEASFLAIVVVLWRRAKERPEQALPAERFFGVVRGGMRYVRFRPELWPLMIRVATFGFCVSSLFSLLPVYAPASARPIAVVRRPDGVSRGRRGRRGVPAAAPRQGPASPSGGRRGDGPARRGGHRPRLERHLLGGVRDRGRRRRRLAHPFHHVPGGRHVAAAQLGAGARPVGVPHGAVRRPLRGRRGLGFRRRPFRGDDRVLRRGRDDRRGTRRHRWRLPVPQGRAADISVGAAIPFPMHEPEETLEPEHGPVVMNHRYSIDPQDADEFLAVMEQLGAARRRRGAIYWAVYRDLNRPNDYVERMVTETWADRLRLRERTGDADLELHQRALSFDRGGRRPEAEEYLVAVGGR